MKKEIEAFLTKGGEWDNNPATAAAKYGNPSPEGCLYCQRSSDLTCPYMSTTLKTIQTKIQGLAFPANFDPANLPSKPEDLMKIMQSKPIIDKIFKAASDRIKELLEEGVQVPGAEIQYAEGSASIVDLKAAYQVAKEFDVSKSEWDNCASVSLTDLKNLIKTKAGRGEKELAVEKLMSALSKANAITIAEPTKKLKIK